MLPSTSGVVDGRAAWGTSVRRTVARRLASSASGWARSSSSSSDEEFPSRARLAAAVRGAAVRGGLSYGNASVDVWRRGRTRGVKHECSAHCGSEVGLAGCWAGAVEDPRLAERNCKVAVSTL